MAGTSDRRVRGVVTCLVVGLWSCGHVGPHAVGNETAPATVRVSAPTAPLPGSAPADPDGVNWIEPPTAGDDGRPRLRLTDRLGDPAARPRGGRILGLLRGGRGPGAAAGGDGGRTVTADQASTSWPHPHALGDQLATLAALRGGFGRHDDVAVWASTTLDDLEAVLVTAGPRDPAAAEVLVRVAADAEAGLRLAPEVTDREVATDVRRASLAIARRVAVWRAAGAACVEAHAAPRTSGFDGLATALTPAGLETVTGRLLVAVEEFEAKPVAAEAASVRAALRSLDGFAAAAPRATARAVTDHYLAPNVRVTVHERFVSRLLPETTVETGPLHDFILGRQVTGTRTVEQSLHVRFVPDTEAIRLELLVNGEVASRTVTASGPVAFHSRGAATFTVRKPVVVSPAGFDLGAALGTASNRTQLANIQTSFDSVPIMGSLVRTIARNQHDDSRQAASREVNERIIMRACREVDRQAGPQFTDAAERVRLRVWEPLVRLGLEPTPVVLSTSEDVATARLRLAGTDQLGAHTPRPRPPADALVAVQLHESAANNACARLGLAGRQLTLEQLVATVATRLGVEPRMPDDLPENVTVSFPIAEPIRVACQDGLVHVWVTLDELESSRRTWCDIVAHVAYRPTLDGMQVFLEREGPVQLSGPGHQGRMEIALRTIFGKIFAKERRIPLVPATLAANPRLADVRAVQAVATDGWLAIALAPTTLAGGTTAPAKAAETPQRRLLRR
jgi:hypothetical protein